MKKKVLVVAKKTNSNTLKYLDALKSVDIEPLHITHYIDTKDYDGLIIAGGADVDPHLYNEELSGSSFSDINFDLECIKLLESFLASKKPVFGICRGLQLINVYFGGTLFQDIKNHRTKHYHPVTVVDNSFLMKVYNENIISVNSFHHQAINKLGSKLEVVATHKDGTIEAIENKDKKIIAVQWHPERMVDLINKEYNGIEIFKYFKTLL